MSGSLKSGTVVCTRSPGLQFVICFYNLPIDGYALVLQKLLKDKSGKDPHIYQKGSGLCEPLPPHLLR